MVSGRMVAGVTAGASTPERVVQEFANTLEAVDPADAGGS
jgi:4-hydroxy-3-methylbut-2-enyl diphosphate reductase IspH